MARYDKLRKLERNARLAKYIEKHPEMSMTEVGARFHISRTRVYQLLTRLAEKGR
jgi:DNA-directed RNA polymerase specialized sigma subunit